MKNIINNNKGFTLIELLAAVTILSVISSIAIYLSVNTIKTAREKSYEVTKANIEHNASIYITESKSQLYYSPDETDASKEYQCVTVNDLIDMGYLSHKVISSPVSNDKKVEKNDSIKIVRNKNTKAVISTEYDITGAKCRSLHGDIYFLVTPDIYQWSKEKTVNITYKLKNYDMLPSYENQYRIVYDDGSEESLISTTQNNVSKKLEKPGTIYAKIVINDTEEIISKSLHIMRIDRQGPTLVCNQNGGIPNIACRTTNHYDITDARVNYNNQVKIPIIVTDNGGSGVDFTTVEKNDFQIQLYNPGTNTYTDITNFTFEKTRDTATKNTYVNLIINDNTNAGFVVIKINEKKIFDYAENENLAQIIYTNITLNMVYELLSNNTHRGYRGTLTTAFNDVQNNWTIRALLDNTSEEIAINKKTNVILDVNGKVINIKASIENGEKTTNTTDLNNRRRNGQPEDSTTSLTIKNSKQTGEIINNTSTMISNYGTLTTTSVKISSDDGRVIGNHGKLTIANGSIINTNSGGVISGYNGEIIVKSGASMSALKATDEGGNAIGRYSSAQGKVIITIEGGTLYGTKYGIGVSCNDTVTGPYSTNGQTPTEITVKGGKITGKRGGIKVWGCATNTEITGGNIIGESLPGVSIGTLEGGEGETNDFCKGECRRTLIIGNPSAEVETATPQIFRQSGRTEALNALEAKDTIVSWYNGIVYGHVTGINYAFSFTTDYSPKTINYRENYYPKTVNKSTTIDGFNYANKTYLAPIYYELINSDGTTKGYTETLSEAFENVNNGGTIKTLQDNTSDAPITNDKNITLNTNGKMITINKIITNNSGKTLTVNGNGTISTESTKIFINNGTMNVSNGTISTESTKIFINNGTMNVSNSNINKSGSSAGPLADNYGTLNITSSTIKGGSFGRLADNYGTLNITSSTIEGSGGVAMYKGSVTVTSSTIHATGSSGNGISRTSGTSDDVQITINDSTIISEHYHGIGQSCAYYDNYIKTTVEINNSYIESKGNVSPISSQCNTEISIKGNSKIKAKRDNAVHMTSGGSAETSISVCCTKNTSGSVTCTDSSRTFDLAEAISNCKANDDDNFGSKCFCNPTQVLKIGETGTPKLYSKEGIETIAAQNWYWYSGELYGQIDTAYNNQPLNKLSISITSSSGTYSDGDDTYHRKTYISTP